MRVLAKPFINILFNIYITSNVCNKGTIGPRKYNVTRQRDVLRMYVFMPAHQWRFFFSSARAIYKIGLEFVGKVKKEEKRGSFLVKRGK